MSAQEKSLFSDEDDCTSSDSSFSYAGEHDATTKKIWGDNISSCQSSSAELPDIPVPPQPAEITQPPPATLQQPENYFSFIENGIPVWPVMSFEESFDHTQGTTSLSDIFSMNAIPGLIPSQQSNPAGLGTLMGHHPEATSYASTSLGLDLFGRMENPSFIQNLAATAMRNPDSNDVYLTGTTLPTQSNSQFALSSLPTFSHCQDISLDFTDYIDPKLMTLPSADNLESASIHDSTGHQPVASTGHQPAASTGHQPVASTSGVPVGDGAQRNVPLELRRHPGASAALPLALPKKQLIKVNPASSISATDKARKNHKNPSRAITKAMDKPEQVPTLKKSQSDKVPCPICSKLLSAKTNNMARHIASQHKGVKHVCDICGHELKFPGDVKRHKKAKHPTAVEDPSTSKDSNDPRTDPSLS